MKLINADELIEHVWRDRVDSRERIANLIESMPAIKETIPAADVISKADMITLLEETEKDIIKGAETSPTGMMIKAVFGVIKCKVNMWKEISSAPYQEDEA